MNRSGFGPLQLSRPHVSGIFRSTTPRSLLPALLPLSRSLRSQRDYVIGEARWKNLVDAIFPRARAENRTEGGCENMVHRYSYRYFNTTLPILLVCQAELERLLTLLLLQG
jgi:hypothetical protein